MAPALQRQPAFAGVRLLSAHRPKGPGTVESFRQFPIRAWDYILADRGYLTAVGMGHVAAAGAHLTVRVNTGALPLQCSTGRPFDLLSAVSALASAGTVGSWPARVVPRQGPPVSGRVCAIRKTEEAIKIALQGSRKEASRKGREVQSSTLQFARYAIVFTTFPAPEFLAAAVLEWYRLRWQVELVFQRLKPEPHTS